MDIYDIKQNFKNSCIQGFCIRKTFKSKQCIKNSKQEQCFIKYLKQLGKDTIKQSQVDEKWIEIQNKVKERDKECLIEKSLTEQELQLIKEKYDFIYYSKKGSVLDCCHIIPRSEAPELIYDLTNVFLAKHIYHFMLDESKNFFTGMFEEGFREKMINRVMHTNKLWKIDYDYDSFKSDNNKRRRK
jgi:hypothetical protein